MSGEELRHLGLILGLFTLHLAVPGPNMLYICACVGRGGRREAAGFAAGSALATMFWAAFVAFGAWHLVAGAPILTESLRLLAGAALIMLGCGALISALRRTALVAPERRHGPATAALQGLVVTLANVNELVFWSAMLMLGAGATHGPAFAPALVATVGLIALGFELGLACLVGAGVLGRIVVRARRALETALGVAFCATGFILLRLF